MQNRYYHGLDHDGWTLLETVLTMVITATLCAVTMPSYRHFILQAQRDYAKAHLMQLTIQLEDYYAQHHSYVGATIDDTGYAAKSYVFSLTGQTRAYYLLEATPTAQQKKDTCGTLSIDSNNTQWAD